MAENRKEAIINRYKTLDSPLYKPVPGPTFMDRVRRRRELQGIIRSLLKQWNISYNWGYPENWWQDVKVETYDDINIWATVQRLRQLEETAIVKQTFFNRFFNSISDAIKKLGNVLTWPILAPFKRAMIKGLQEKGFSTSGNLETIARRFVDKIVKKRGQDANNSQKFETADPVSATVIINLIIEFFKTIQKDAKDEDEKTMAAIAAADGNNAASLIEAENNGNNDNSGDGESMNFGGITKLLFIVLGLYIFFKYVAKG